LSQPIGIQNRVMEWMLTSVLTYDDPFNEIELDVVFTDPTGRELRVPAFWSGNQTWRIRYASHVIGMHQFCTICSDESNDALHGQKGELEVRPYQGDNVLFKHGPICVNSEQVRLEHADGTPFFWLADTWWMAFCQRLHWPGDFQSLLNNRVEKGFSVIQIVAGLFPDMAAFDERGANEAGFPWEKDFARINPAYFDMADMRVDRLVESGMSVCVVGAWGYYLKWMTVEQMRKHWRNIVARWGAYPVTWCLAGETLLPYYMSPADEKPKEEAHQKKAWTELTSYVCSINGFDRPVTIHPTAQLSGSDQIEDRTLLDFDMLQTGHSAMLSVARCRDGLRSACSKQPRIPVLNGEICYEGIGFSMMHDMQRLYFWICMLNGACGHSYGANGIWQMNGIGQPYGPSPHGMTWGNRPWIEAMELEGSTHLGIGKRLLERYEYWRFEPNPQWIDPHWDDDNIFLPFAAGIAGIVRVIYWNIGVPSPVMKQIEPGVQYYAYLYNPVDGSEVDMGEVEPDSKGDWHVPYEWPPFWQDWIIVLDTQGGRTGQVTVDSTANVPTT